MQLVCLACLCDSFLRSSTTVSCLDAESDYGPLSDRVVEIPEGATNISFAIAITPDMILEGEETFSVELTVSPNAHQVSSGRVSFAVITIIDDDGRFNISAW